jgi:hypothetical protein
MAVYKVAVGITAKVWTDVVVDAASADEAREIAEEKAYEEFETVATLGGECLGHNGRDCVESVEVDSVERYQGEPD